MRRALIGVLLASLVLSAPAAAETPALPAVERLLLSEAFRLAEQLGEEIWPGWDEAPFEVLLVDADYEYLVHSPRAPEGFVELGRDELIGGRILARPRTVPPGLRATFPILGGPPLVVVGRLEATGLAPTDWLAMVLHEHFHQLQMADADYYADVEALDLAGGDESGNWMLDFPFPYEEPVVAARFEGLCATIRASLSGEIPAAWVGEALSGLGAVLPSDAYRYLGFQLWQEGVARYVQYRAAQVAGERFEPSPAFVALPGYRPFSEVAAELHEQILAELAEPRLAKQRRVAFYAAGAGLALLLDQQDAGWRRSYLKRKFALEELLP